MTGVQTCALPISCGQCQLVRSERHLTLSTDEVLGRVEDRVDRQLAPSLTRLGAQLMHRCTPYPSSGGHYTCGMRIAAVQHDIVWNDRAENFRRIAPMIAAAAAIGSQDSTSKPAIVRVCVSAAVSIGGLHMLRSQDSESCIR